MWRNKKEKRKYIKGKFSIGKGKKRGKLCYRSKREGKKKMEIDVY